MDRQVKTRLGWVNLYLETKNAGFVCIHCGVSRPTLRKWVNRYQELGLEGLFDQSKKPKSCSNRKINDEITTWILFFRNERNLGARRIQSELQRLHNISISLATIHKVLTNNNSKPIRKLKRHKKFIRYSRPIPGDRVQIDTCKIGPGIYQYTAVDDCSRFRVLDIYPRRTAANTLKFIDKMIEEFPFPIQRIQSDRGLEFFAEKVQKKMMKYCIKFRPVKDSVNIFSHFACDAPIPLCNHRLSC
jgi:transposase